MPRFTINDLVYATDDRGVREVFKVDAYIAAMTPTPLQLDMGARQPDVVTCGTCGRSWDDAVVSGLTPAPSGRCPFEHDHPEPVEDPEICCYVSERDGAMVVEISYSGHLRVIVGEGTVFDADTETSDVDLEREADRG